IHVVDSVTARDRVPPLASDGRLLALSPDSRRIAIAATVGNQIAVRDITSGATVASFGADPQYPALTATFSSDTSLLAVRDQTGTLDVASLISGQTARLLAPGSARPEFEPETTNLVTIFGRSVQRQPLEPDTDLQPDVTTRASLDGRWLAWA